MTQRNRGFVALLSILLVTVIAFFLFAKFYFAPRVETGEIEAIQPTNADGTAPTTEMGRIRADIDGAEKARLQLNEQNQMMNTALGE